MRIVTWNMGCGSPRYTGRYRKARDEAWQLLLGLAPDVVLVQEALLDLPAWVRADGNVIAQERAYDAQDAGSAILLRGGLVGVPQMAAVAGSYVAAAEVMHTDGPIFVASVHIGTKSQRKNLKHLIDVFSPLVNGRRFIIGGDFNAARRWDVVYKKNVYGWFFDALAERGYHDCHYGLHGREDRSFWRREEEGAYQLDHLFIEAGGATRVRSCTVVTNDDTRRLSDHSPLVLELA